MDQNKQLSKVNNELVYSGFKLLKNGLEAIGQPTFEQWSECGEFIKKSNSAMNFWIGDWLNYGKAKYGETYSQAIHETDFEYGTLANAKYVSSKIEPSRRRENLSFAHHQELASLPIDKQDKWLKKASEDNLTREELRIFLREDKLNNKEDDIDDRKIVPYGDNIFYLSSKFQDFPSDFVVIKNGEKWPTLKRRSWFYHEDMTEYSLREYAEVQTFPDTFKFVGPYEKIKDQIGNAVAPQMAKHIGGKLKGKTIGDLFAGCGGLSCGLEMTNKRSLWAIERNVDYARTYKVNHPNAKVFTRDIKKINPKTLDKVDIIVGGPPCQGFSLSGIRFADDPRNELYKEFVRFVKELKPGEFLLENVPQIETMKDQIIKDFEEVGYKVESFLVKGEDIGMRQHRHRYFFYGSNTTGN